MTHEERAVLDLEARRWKYAGAKEATIRDELGLSPTRYYQLLGALLERPDAEAYAPQTVHRLRRVRDARRAARRGATCGTPADFGPLHEAS